jgi:hypothetical protein
MRSSHLSYHPRTYAKPKVVDLKNEASSGAGWTIGENGLPRLPINSVLIVLGVWSFPAFLHRLFAWHVPNVSDSVLCTLDAFAGVGGVILEAASHAPVFSIFMPRVLQVRQ